MTRTNLTDGLSAVLSDRADLDDGQFETLVKALQVVAMMDPGDALVFTREALGASYAAAKGLDHTQARLESLELDLGALRTNLAGVVDKLDRLHVHVHSLPQVNVLTDMQGKSARGTGWPATKIWPNGI